MEKFLENLDKAEKMIARADHMLYVTYPLIKEKRLLLRILEDLKLVIANCINSILQYEYLFRRVSLYKNPRLNFENFTRKCAQKYGITREEIEGINKVFNLVKKHKESEMEFIRNEKIVIMVKNLSPETLTLEEIKEFLNLARTILIKTEKKLKLNI